VGVLDVAERVLDPAVVGFGHDPVLASIVDVDRGGPAGAVGSLPVDVVPSSS